MPTLTQILHPAQANIPQTADDSRIFLMLGHGRRWLLVLVEAGGWSLMIGDHDLRKRVWVRSLRDEPGL